MHLALDIDIAISPASVTQEAWELISFSLLERQVQNLLSSRNANGFVDFCLFTMCLRSPRNLASLCCYNRTSVTMGPENTLFWYFGRYIPSPFLQLFSSALQPLHPSHQRAGTLLAAKGECTGLINRLPAAQSHCRRLLLGLGQFS